MVQNSIMKSFINWLLDRFSGDEEESDMPLRLNQSSKVSLRRPTTQSPPVEKKPAVEFSSELEGKIEDGGPGKNVLVRNKYLREDTGTHETLKIIDDSVDETSEGDGIDPYNTGRFDRSKSWDSFRTRK